MGFRKKWAGKCDWYPPLSAPSCYPGPALAPFFHPNFCGYYCFAESLRKMGNISLVLDPEFVSNGIKNPGNTFSDKLIFNIFRGKHASDTLELLIIRHSFVRSQFFTACVHGPVVCSSSLLYFLPPCEVEWLRRVKFLRCMGRTISEW